MRVLPWFAQTGHHRRRLLTYLRRKDYHRYVALTDRLNIRKKYLVFINASLRQSRLLGKKIVVRNTNTDGLCLRKYFNMQSAGWVLKIAEEQRLIGFQFLTGREIRQKGITSNATQPKNLSYQTR